MAGDRVPVARALALLLVLLLLLAVAADSVRRGLSDLVAQEARYEFERARSARRLAPELADSIRSELLKAASLAPDNPSIQEDLARLDAARVRGDPEGPEVRAVRERALNHYRAAARARPTSPHAHLGLAVLKLELGQADREFSFFLERAFEFGPWEPQLQLLAIHLGLTAWQGLPASTRERIRVAIANQMSWEQVNQRAAVTDLLQRFGRMDLMPGAAPGAAR